MNGLAAWLLDVDFALQGGSCSSAVVPLSVMDGTDDLMYRKLAGVKERTWGAFSSESLHTAFLRRLLRHHFRQVRGAWTGMSRMEQAHS